MEEKTRRKRRRIVPICWCGGVKATNEIQRRVLELVGLKSICLKKYDLDSPDAFER